MSELKLIASAKLPTPFAEFMVHAYLAEDGKEHLAVVLGDIAPRTVEDADITLQPASAVAPLVRVHSECLTGDALFSLRCDCGAQLRAALEKIANEGRGVLLYLRQEGRGIGLGNKIRAYALQDQGADTVEANRRLGFPADARDYGLAVRLLQDLGLDRIRLMTNNPAKLDALVRDGVEVVERIPLERGRNAFNTDYLDTKMTRMGHLFGAKGAL